MATQVNRAPHNLIPKDWAFHPEIGPFVREILNQLWQLRNKTGGDDDFIAAITIQSDDTLLSAMESRIAFLESQVNALQRENDIISRVAAIESRLDGLDREIVIPKPEPQTDMVFSSTLIYDLLARVNAIEAQL